MSWMQWPRGLCGWTPEPGPQGRGHVRALPSLPHVAAENQVAGGGGVRERGEGRGGRCLPLRPLPSVTGPGGWQ